MVDGSNCPAPHSTLREDPERLARLKPNIQLIYRETVFAGVVIEALMVYQTDLARDS